MNFKTIVFKAILLIFREVQKENDPISAIGASGISDLDKFRKWIVNARLDPNDPDDADLMLYRKVLMKVTFSK